MKPYKFEPILKSTIWGGYQIAPFKGIYTAQPNIGESWEISGVPGQDSVAIERGLIDDVDVGLTLTQLIDKYKGLLVGNKVYKRFGNKFPLLVKFIDSRQDLSVQVHPDDKLAMERHGCAGKTEMWYIIKSDVGAKIYAGLKKSITPEDYEQMVTTDSREGENPMANVIATHEAHQGDLFFLPAGRLHAIGAGCFLAEIQQTSDITYRLYDFMRRDKDGNLRELHLQEAGESIHYHSITDNHIPYTRKKNEGVELVRCPWFTTSVYDLDEPMVIDYSDLDSFVILIGVKGSGVVVDNEGHSMSLCAGETILLPACTNEIKVEGEVRFLETYV